MRSLRSPLLAAALVLGGAGGGTAVAQSPLEGGWTSVTPSPNSRMSTQLVFGRDHTLRTTMVQLVAGSYRIEGDTLIVLDSAGAPFATYRVAGNTLFHGAGRAEVALGRARGTEVPGAPLAGLWRPRPDPASRMPGAELQLTSGGCVRYIWVVGQQSGRWALSGDSLAMTLRGRPTTHVRVEVRADTLVIDDGRQGSRFRRLTSSDGYADREARCDVPAKR